MFYIVLLSHLLNAQVVAVIDTGFDFNNAQLKKSLWQNPGEIPGNEIDDDNNGYVDDIHGWDFVANRPLGVDRQGHGTHIAGLILAPQPTDSAVRVMILKYYDQRSTLTDTLKNTVAALSYAIRMKADIINYSSGGNTPNQLEKDAIQSAERQGILVVTAAGNNGMDMLYEKFYPAAYGFSNLLAVTAVDETKSVLATSNYGESFVQLAAPGKNILSWTPGQTQKSMTGTSQATAIVTGEIARILNERPELRGRPAQVIRLMNAGAESIQALAGKVQDLAFLNAEGSRYLRDAGETALGHARIETTFTQP